MAEHEQHSTNARKLKWLRGCCIGSVVLSAAAVLSVIIPAFYSASLVNQSIACQSNLHQMTLAISEYVADNNETLPLSNSWSNSIAMYIPGQHSREQMLLQCPANKRTPFGYSMNKLIGGHKADWGDDDLALTICLFEQNDTTANSYGLPADMVWRHYGTANVSFIDGHVRRLSRKQLGRFGSYFRVHLSR